MDFLRKMRFNDNGGGFILNKYKYQRNLSLNESFHEWSYAPVNVTADIFFKIFLKFMMPLFFLGHVFGSMMEIIKCIKACSSSIDIMHTYHCMIH